MGVTQVPGHEEFHDARVGQRWPHRPHPRAFSVSGGWHGSKSLRSLPPCQPPETEKLPPGVLPMSPDKSVTQVPGCTSRGVRSRDNFNRLSGGEVLRDVTVRAPIIE